MAKRSFNKKARALAPAVMKLHFEITAAEALGLSTAYISISHSVSRLNRRFYRQGMNWAVANVKVTQQPGAAGGSTAYVNTLPHTWTTANAWLKAQKLWLKQQNEALMATDSMDTAARYRDFKVSMEEGHTVGVDLSPANFGPGRAPAFPLTFGPTSNLPALLASAEWEASQVVIPNDGAPGVTNEYNFHMVGIDTGTSKAIIQGYADSRDRPHSPDPDAPVISGSWMQEMFDVGDDSAQVTDNAQFHNNELPYDQDHYPGGSVNFTQLETQGVNWNQSTVGINTFNTGPFTAPCGLIRIDFTNQAPVAGSSSKNMITVELVPGTHRGYLAETMEEF